ncbi:MAG: TonB-dependent receptor [Gemmatimonadaceae bacterium]|nr:TonB-dependent receptor [Gemmatimonadaceae bacterium]
MTVARACLLAMWLCGAGALAAQSGATRVTGARDPDRGIAEGAIVGRVTDSETHGGIAAAVIVVEGTALRATSASDGSYRIAHVPAGVYAVRARRIGYGVMRQRIVVRPGEEVTAGFALTAAPVALDAVVTTATGGRRTREVGNAIVRIEADSLVGIAPATTLSSLIDGRAPGVQVFTSGGLTGASPQINVRGQNSFTLSNQPLLIIDGVRVENSAADLPPDGTFGGQTSGRFNDLTPEEIASIEIVRGPSAATLYGTDAANGVILVTTKRGASGRQRWTAFAEQGLLTYDRNRFPLSYFAWGHDMLANPVNCTLQQFACVRDSITTFSPIRNAETTPIGTGSRESYGLQLSGGGETRYFVSGVFEDETGYLKMPNADRAIIAAQRGALGVRDEEQHPNALRKVSVRSTLTTPLGASGDLALSTSVVSQRDRIPFSRSIQYGVAGPGYRDANDGWLFGARPGYLFEQRHDESVTHFTAGATPTWHPTSWLTTRATGGLDYSSTSYDALVRRGEGGPFSDGTGYRGTTRRNVTLYTFDASAVASAALTPRISSRSSIGLQYNRRDMALSIARARGLAPGSEDAGGGAFPSVAEATVQSVVAGSYAEETFGFDEQLFVTAALRADGASSFGNDFRTALYPKASVSWVISEAPFWPRVPGISTLRLRAAYGESGVQPSSTAALARDTVFPAIADGVPTTGAVLASTGNPRLKPERQRELELGFDAELLRGRVQLEATYYDKRSHDALVDVPAPASLGGGVVTENIGAVRNHGVEASVQARVLDRSAIAWDIGLGASVNHNKLLTLGAGIQPIYGQFGTPSIVPGYPLFSYFDFPITGWTDMNGNGVVEPSEVTIGSTRAYAGASYPTTEITATTTVGLLAQRLRVSALVDHRGGLTLANRTRSDQCFSGYCRAVVDPGAPLADRLAAAAYTEELGYSFWGYFEDGAFTRLRELSVSYDLPRPVLRRLHAERATLVLAGRNLLLWTRFRDTDPEVQTVNLGVPKYGAYSPEGGIPPARSWILRLNLGF